jgi:hypothetical protein
LFTGSKRKYFVIDRFPFFERDMKNDAIEGSQSVRAFARFQASEVRIVG